MADDAMVVTSWVATASCPACGAPLCHVADGRPTDNGRRISAIVHCAVDRRHRYQLIAELVPLNQPSFDHATHG